MSLTTPSCSRHIQLSPGNCQGWGKHHWKSKKSLTGYLQGREKENGKNKSPKQNKPTLIRALKAELSVTFHKTSLEIKNQF